MLRAQRQALRVGWCAQTWPLPSWRCQAKQTHGYQSLHQRAVQHLRFRLKANKSPFLVRPQRQAAALGVALVCPDTSPRGLSVPGEADSWDFGVGAGFYVNATQERWRNWRMYAYVTEELPTALRSLPALDVDTVRPRDAPPLVQYDRIPCQKERCIASRSSNCLPALEVNTVR